ncbi:MAG: helicase-related protein, partial [Blastocatellia bacterium]
LYPGAQILTTLGNFTKDRRKKMVARIATGDYDLIILTHEHLDMLPMRPVTREAFVNAELEELQGCIDDYKSADSDRGDARAVKRLEKLKQNIEERLIDAIQNSRKDDAVFFEETGIDFLFVDESHHYKSLPCYTKRDRVKGIPSSRSDKATNLWMRARWLQQRNAGRGLAFATGTCITNSLCELYILQRYLQYDELVDRGVAAFDAWANVFGDLVTRVEYAVTGDFKAVTRFAKYVNIPELLQIAGQMMDVQFADGIIDIKRPERRDSVISSPMSADQKRYLQRLKERAKRLKKVEPSEDNMLAISNDARKMSLDFRLIRRSAVDGPDSKINKLVENVLRIYRERPQSTQLVFCDLGVNLAPTGFWVYGDIIDKLVEGGIARDLIIDFSRVTDRAKEEAMKRLRSGEAVIGLGSTATLGTGVNVQDRCYAGHHVDVPWRPDAVEQRDGRVWRHGNMHYDLHEPVALY